MFKLTFLFVVLTIVTVVTSNPHPRQNHQSKKVHAAERHPHSLAHHAPESHHGKPVTRVARSHGHGGGSHAPVHHPQGKFTQHSKKLAGARFARGIHGGSSHGHQHGDSKAALHRPAKNRGHRK